MTLTETEHNEANPLATAPIGKLMMKYAVPSVIALVVNALYNIVDQVFIGWGVGTLGNSATNVIFPLNMVVTAFSLLLGDGGAAFLSLELGRDNRKKAQKGVNNTLSWLIITAILFFIIFSVFLKPLTNMLGATPDNQAYALAYGRIVVIGFPFVVIGSGMCSLIRADGTPHLTMISMIVGCVSQYHMSPSTVMKEIRQSDKSRCNHYNNFTGKEWGDRHNYDLLLNSSTIGYEKCADIICELCGN